MTSTHIALKKSLIGIAVCSLTGWGLADGSQQMRTGEPDVVKPAAAQSPTLAGLRPNIVLVLTDDQGYGDLSAGAAPSSAGW